MSLQNIDGLTIHNLSTGQSALSTCAGSVRFHNPTGGAHNYSVDAGTGTRCGDSSIGTFDAFPSTSEGPGVIELTVGADPLFLSDGLVFTAGTSIDGRQAPIGGLWSDIQLDTKENPSGTGILAGTGHATQDCRTINLVTPPNPNYFVECTLHCNVASNKQQQGLMIHVQPGTFHAYQLQYFTVLNKIQLTRWDGSNIVLASIPFILYSGHNTSVALRLGYNGGILHWRVNGVEQATVADTTWSSAGHVGVTAHVQVADYPAGSWMTAISAQTY